MSLNPFVFQVNSDLDGEPVTLAKELAKSQSLRISGQF